jgi:hypothetical protein
MTTEHCGAKVEVQALGMTGDRCDCQVMMHHLYFTLDCMLDCILNHNQAIWGQQHSNFIWWFWQQQWCLCSFLFLCNIHTSKCYYLKSVEVTLPSHLLCLSSRNKVRSKPWLNNIRDMSNQRHPFGEYSSTTICFMCSALQHTLHLLSIGYSWCSSDDNMCWVLDLGLLLLNSMSPPLGLSNIATPWIFLYLLMVFQSSR